VDKGKGGKSAPADSGELGAKPPADKPVTAPLAPTEGTGEVQMGKEVKIGNEIRKGGTVSWRTNNPGNISYGGLSKKYGALGTWKKLDGDAQQRSVGIAIMPNLDAGDELKMGLWRRPMYIDKTIDQGVAQWTGTTGLGSGYAKDLAKAAGATLDTVVGELSDAQLKSMVQKQRVWEGFKEGQVIQARDGGIFDGPKSGYPATLHGNEAVIPLKNGAVPVVMSFKDMPRDMGFGTGMLQNFDMTMAKINSRMTGTQMNDDLANPVREVAEANNTDSTTGMTNSFQEIKTAMTALVAEIKQSQNSDMQAQMVQLLSAISRGTKANADASEKLARYAAN
jgi:hypothetical protein